MASVMDDLSEALDQQRPFAYCRLVETRGSTPQKAGATMLVFPDGQQSGTLGGGCVEAEVKRKALGILDNRQARIATFQLDHDYGWDDGLICGGRMKILIQPVTGESDAIRYYRKLCDVDRCGGGTEVIVFDEPKAQLPETNCFLFDATDRLVASLHAPCDAPATLRDGLRTLSQRPRAYAVQGAAFLPTLPHCRLIIVGGGHIGKAVADLAYDLEFDVWAIDDRPEFVVAERFPRAVKRLSGDLDDLLPGLEITPDTYCLILTRGHSHDERALYHLVQRDARYVGMIGSRRKIKTIYDDLMNEGVPAEQLNRVYAPLGIDIGSQTVAEIAVSICAELIAHRNRGGQVPGRPDPVGRSGSGSHSQQPPAEPET